MDQVGKMTDVTQLLQVNNDLLRADVIKEKEAHLAARDDRMEILELLVKTQGDELSTLRHQSQSKDDQISRLQELLAEALRQPKVYIMEQPMHDPRQFLVPFLDSYPPLPRAPPPLHESLDRDRIESEESEYRELLTELFRCDTKKLQAVDPLRLVDLMSDDLVIGEDPCTVIKTSGGVWGAAFARRRQPLSPGKASFRVKTELKDSMIIGVAVQDFTKTTRVNIHCRRNSGYRYDHIDHMPRIMFGANYSAHVGVRSGDEIVFEINTDDSTFYMKIGDKEMTARLHEDYDPTIPLYPVIGLCNIGDTVTFLP